MKTLAGMVREWALSSPRKVAMREKRLGVWQEVTWESYWDTVQRVARALLALGVQPGDRVAILSENRREWLYVDAACSAIRAASVGIYPTNPAPEVAYVLAHSEANVLFAEDQEQVDKISPGQVRHLIYLEPRGIRPEAGVTPWEEFLELGSDADLPLPAERDDIATLIYTSGTTGKPKGAMLTVANVEFAMGVLVGGGFTSPPPTQKDTLLSYLPLCHVAERVFTTWFNAIAGTQVHFGESIATVQADLREVQPTILFGVPRIWEKVLAGVTIRLANATLFKRLYARGWMRVARWIGGTLVKRQGRHSWATRAAYGLGWVFFFRALRERLGMRNVRFGASGAAPIAPEVLRFFMGIGVPMFELYGMTENTGVATGNRPGAVRVGTVGQPQEGVELRIVDGELQTRHAGVFPGYFRDPEATAAALTEDGWLRTGDVGEWVDGTHIKITDRAKDILITAGGKNIAPSEIENELKTSPYVKEAVVVGDRKPFVAALIGIEPDTVGDWAQRRGIAYSTYRDLTEKPEVVKLMQSIVDEVNAGRAPVEQVRRFRLLPKLLDHEDGELTPTQKVKRSAITTTFGGLVEELYRG